MDAKYTGTETLEPDVPAASGAAKQDPLLWVVTTLARHWKRVSSPDVLLAGIPLENGVLTRAALPRVLERAGMVSEHRHARLANLARFDLPAVVTGTDGDCLLLLDQKGKGKFTGLRESDGGAVEIDTADPVWRKRKRILLIRPKPGSDHAGAETAGNEADDGGNWLLAAVRGHSRDIFLVFLAAVFINLFAVAMPLFTLNVYDRVLPNQAVATLWVLAIGLGLVFVFDFLLKIARAAIVDFAGRSVDFRLSADLFQRVMNTTLAARPESTGAFVNRISQYEVLREFLTSHTVVMFVDVLFMGLFVYIMSILIGWVAIIPVIAAIIAIVATFIIGKRSGRAVKAVLQESSVRNSVLVEALTASQTVKAARAEGALQRRWETSILASSETQSQLKRHQTLATYLTASVTQASSVGIIIGGTYAFAAGEVSMGAIIAAMMLSSRVLAPVGMISAALLRVRGAMEAYHTLGQIMNLPDERAMRHGFITREIQGGALEFKKVRFAYPDTGHYVLDTISLSIQPGEKVAIIGRVGSGKTTLGRLLVRFYEADEGEILIDGVAINQYHPAALRRQIGLVLQEPELFAGTIRENILLAAPEASQEELLDVARRAGVEDFVARHPLGYDMPVGERGVFLSGGQRQAVALARALLAQPKILFLDEPSSSMDLATERQLITSLHASLKPEHTVLIATHRHSLLSLVSRIIILDQGRIAADGPREEILARLRAGQGEAEQ